MVEVSLTALLPGLGVKAASPAGATGGITAQQGQSVLAGLASGSLIKGFVLNRDAKGNPVLRTDAGDFLLQTPFFLKIGSEVVVRTSGTGANVCSTLVTVDGLTPEQAAALPAHASDTDVVTDHRAAIRPHAASVSSAEQSEEALRQPAGVIQARLIAPPAQRSAASALAPSPGSVFTLKVLDIATPPQTALGDVPDMLPAHTPAYAAYAKASAPPGIPAAQANLSAFPLPEAEGGGLAVQALLVGFSDDGEPVVQTPVGTLQLLKPQALPIGSVLTLVLPLNAAPETLPPATLLELASSWPALDELMAQLEGIAPETAARLARNLAPLTGGDMQPQNLGSGLLFFVAALKGADIKTVLGSRATQLLEERGAGALIARAGAEFAQLRDLYFSASPGQWQALLVPFLVEGEVKPLRWFVKREGGNTSPSRARESDGDTRFVVEMDLSQLGALQLDGFVKHRESTQFDLIVRSHTPLDADTRRAIVEIYNSAGELNGYKGMLIFQETPEFPVRPLEDILAERHREVMA